VRTQRTANSCAQALWLCAGLFLSGRSAAQDVRAQGDLIQDAGVGEAEVDGSDGPDASVSPSRGDAAITSELNAEEQASPAWGAAEHVESAVTDGAAASERIVYLLERVEVVGHAARADVVRRFVPLKPGDMFDVDDPAIEQLRFRLLGTGWFNDVRLRLKRGSARGRVVLVIEVQDRNTLVISRVVAGLSRVVTDKTTRDKLRPYAGLGLYESNLLGLGIGVGASAVVSEQQLGLDLRYYDPISLGSGFDLTGRAFYNHAREFFGREPIVARDDCPMLASDEQDPAPCDPDVRSRRAVVIYDRYGFGIGTGHDITGALRYELDWLGEIVDVGAKPRAASTLRGERGQERAPIDFHIDDGQSYVSSLHFGLIFDRRDDPALPSRGQILRFDARMGTSLLGSTYDFARIEANLRQFVPLPWRHVLSVGVFLGTAFGRAPFFYRFYAADLSDLLPSRALELNLDHRRTHNLLGTSIREFDKENLAARIDFEYQLPLHRGSGGLRRIDAYAGAGLFLLGERSVMRMGLPGYEGIERIPFDLTFDLGVQAETAVGVFKVGFSSLIGFLPDLGQETR
jgi:outer membrane protein insertion porin family